MKKMAMKDKKDLTVNEAIEHFIRKCTARNLSPRTLKMYKERLGIFQRFLDDDSVIITDITTDTVDDYTLYLRETGNRNDVTVTSHLRELRVFLYFCMNEGQLSQFKIKLPKADKQIKERNGCVNINTA